MEKWWDICVEHQGESAWGGQVRAVTKAEALELAKKAGISGEGVSVHEVKEKAPAESVVGSH